jgi:Glycine rich protein
MKMKHLLWTLVLTAAGLGGHMQAQTTICAGQQACLTIPAHRGTVQWESSPDQNTWTAISGATSDTLCLTPSGTTYYHAIVSEGTCAPVVSSMSTVTVSSPVIADGGSDVSSPAGVDVQVGGSPAASGGTPPYTYSWVPANAFNNATLANPLFNVQGSGAIALFVTDANGCTDGDTVMVATISSQTFTFTGAPQTFTVPNNVTTVTINACGAQGGANWVNNVNYGGCTQATITVTPGEVLTVYVGEQPTSGLLGGYNGGGPGDANGKGGGGGSDVRQGGTTLNNRVVVGGGGGGAGYWSNLHVAGGVGGGLTGGDGLRLPSDPGGLGGTQTGPGATGTCSSLGNPSMAGAFGQGGPLSGFGCGCEGYGGGGGWYGGAGSGNCRGGGGGSGYAIPTATSVSYTSGTQVGNGVVTITW